MNRKDLIIVTGATAAALVLGSAGIAFASQGADDATTPTPTSSVTVAPTTVPTTGSAGVPTGVPTAVPTAGPATVPRGHTHHGRGRDDSATHDVNDDHGTDAATHDANDDHGSDSGRHGGGGRGHGGSDD